MQGFNVQVGDILGHRRVMVLTEFVVLKGEFPVFVAAVNMAATFAVPGDCRSAVEEVAKPARHNSVEGVSN